MLKLMREELSMVTGTISEDITYLYYLLVKDGSYKNEIKKLPKFNNENTVDTLEDWFNKI